MIQCALCMYAGNPDTATSCVKCKTPLAPRPATLTEDNYPPQRGETAVESYPTPIASNRRQTLAEGMPPAAPSAPARPAEPNTPPARWSDSGSHDQAQRRRTVYIGTPADETSPASATPRGPQGPPVGAVRKIIGVLITYSWKEEGEIFPVYQGRNYIGTDPKCEICVPSDTTLSGINTSINFRMQFLISDKDSMSGTDVDGKPVFTDAIPLRNYATIRTGSTYWTFVAIHPAEGVAGVHSTGEPVVGA